MLRVILRCHWTRPLVHTNRLRIFWPVETVWNVRGISTLIDTKYGALVSKAAVETPNTPVVAILGWNDAKMKNLQKYSKIFEEKEWTTVCLPATSFNTFARPGSKVRTISMHMVDVLKQLTSKGNPVFLYSLSSGGCTVYYHIAKALTMEGSPNFDAFKVIGAIFDSCPVKNTKEGVSRLQISVTERVSNPVVKNLIWYGVYLVMPFAMALDPLIGTIFDELKTLTLNCPELYVYSKADKLALYQDIEDFVLERKSQGATVLSKQWDNSPHCSHYMKYPEEYLRIA
ncbi:transmembrane protein 53-like [Dendronephthya gigantea]|uniref:transmembrane protein 53-like n=1 Tax=Dendronephthya gigantea TaxID=151771 RepID=UPI00106D245E|nr:transmembrane protein 53-like [Dendronephthya gigantea]